MSDERIFWLKSEPPTGPLVVWRGNGGVDWERRYVPAAELEAAREQTIQDVCRWLREQSGISTADVRRMGDMIDRQFPR